MEGNGIVPVMNMNGQDHCYDGGCGSWVWIIVLFALLMGGNGFGGNRGYDGAITRNEMTSGFDFQELKNSILGTQKGLCDGFYAQNTTMLNGFNGIGSAVAESRFAAQQCCCETNRNIDAVRYENAQNTGAITTAIHAEAEATRAMMQANMVQELRDRLTEKDQALQTANFRISQQLQNAYLVSTLRPFPQPAYITCSPYTPVNGGGCANGLV